MLLNFFIWLPVAVCHFNGVMQFMLGEKAPDGAVRVYKDYSMDLETDCGGKRCPSVVIFAGQQYGTIEMGRCYVGQMYFFINMSKSDLGITVQQKGGLFGAKNLAQFATGNCFCYPRGPEELARERRLLDSLDGEKPAVEEQPIVPNEGVLLCG